MVHTSSSFLVVEEKFLNVEWRSRMLVNWQNISLSQFLCNPTFGVISTIDILANLKLQVAKKFFWNY